MREDAVTVDANKMDDPILLLHESQETQVLELVDLGAGAGVSQDAQVEISVMVVEDCFRRPVIVQTLVGLEPLVHGIPLAQVQVAEGGRHQGYEEFILVNSEVGEAAHVAVDGLDLVEQLVNFGIFVDLNLSYAGLFINGHGQEGFSLSCSHTGGHEAVRSVCQISLCVDLINIISLGKTDKSGGFATSNET